MKRLIINPPSSALASRTHASPVDAATRLRSLILEAEAWGMEVLSATSSRCSVPNSYGGTKGMVAPAWVFDSMTRTIDLHPLPLANRANGTGIPAAVVVRGDHPTPAGWRCIRRNTISTEFRIR